MKNKYIISVTILSVLLFVAIICNVILLVLTNDLTEKVQMQDNTIGVCKIDLEKVQIENEELREKCFEK